MKYKKGDEFIFTKEYPFNIGTTFKKGFIGKIITESWGNTEKYYGMHFKSSCSDKTFCYISIKDLENHTINLKQKKIEEILK